MSNTVGKYLFMFIVLVLLQVLLLNHIQISGLINPYMYILFILLLPFDTPKFLLLVSGFLLGLTIDTFTNTPGMHASATTFLAFIRPGVINLISSRDVFELNVPPRIGTLGFNWFFKYCLSLVLIHHFILFYVEAFTLHGFFITFSRSILSAIFTVVLIIISQYLIYKEQ